MIMGKILKRSTCQEVWDLLMKIMKSLTYLGITKFFFFKKKKNLIHINQKNLNKNITTIKMNNFLS